MQKVQRLIRPLTQFSTFEGRKESVVIPAGGTVTSDAVEYPVEALEQVAVTASLWQSTEYHHQPYRGEMSQLACCLVTMFPTLFWELLRLLSAGIS